jgi:predicted P-loop ATPase
MAKPTLALVPDGALGESRDHDLPGRLGIARELIDEWIAQCICIDKKPVANLANVETGLRILLPEHFAFDEMEQAATLLRCLYGNQGFKPRAVTDRDVYQVRRLFQQLGLRRIDKESVYQAIVLRAHLQSSHPVRNYLDGLKWDGHARIDRFLECYLGAERGCPYAGAIGRMFLIQMVARIYKPGCKADYMLVLEGEQGALKSTACSVLSAGWFSDCLPDVRGGKECAQHLRGKWLIEVPEMHAMDRAGAAQLKQFITRQEERYRPPYGRLEVREPRQCVFIGTTNKEAYLRDETGGRRFWPVKVVGNIEIEALQDERDQLFAEAVVAFRKGEPWWPNRQFEREHIMPQQAARYEADPWVELVERYLRAESPDRIRLTQVAAGIGLTGDRMTRAESNRLAIAMEMNGWRRGKHTRAGVEWHPIHR